MLADPLRRHRQARRPPDRVEDGALAHQDEDEGGARAPRRRDERAPVLRRSLLRLRRRDLRVAPPARDPRDRSAHRSRELLADVPKTFATPEMRVDCPDAIKFDVVRAVHRALQEQGATRCSTSTARACRSDERRAGVGPRARVEHRADPGHALRGEPRGARATAIRARSRPRSCEERAKLGPQAERRADRTKVVDRSRIARSNWATDDFRARGIESPRLDAELLVACALGIDAHAGHHRRQAPARAGRARAAPRAREAPARARAGRVPPRRARVLRARLRGRPRACSSRAPTPRRSSRSRSSARAHCSMSDARARPVHRLGLRRDHARARAADVAACYATDVSEPTRSRVARENALRLGAYNVALRRGRSLRRGVPRPQFDVVTANPPVHPERGDRRRSRPDIRDFEPRLALDGGADGLDVVRRIVAAAPEHLVPRRRARARGRRRPSARGRAAASSARGFAHVTATRDYGRIERVVSGVCRTAEGRASSRSHVGRLSGFFFALPILALSGGAHWLVASWAMRAFPRLARSRGPRSTSSGVLVVLAPALRFLAQDTRRHSHRALRARDGRADVRDLSLRSSRRRWHRACDRRLTRKSAAPEKARRPRRRRRRRRPRRPRPTRRPRSRGARCSSARSGSSRSARRARSSAGGSFAAATPSRSRRCSCASRGCRRRSTATHRAGLRHPHRPLRRRARARGGLRASPDEARSHRRDRRSRRLRSALRAAGRARARRSARRATACSRSSATTTTTRAPPEVDRRAAARRRRRAHERGARPPRRRRRRFRAPRRRRHVGAPLRRRRAAISSGRSRWCRATCRASCSRISPTTSNPRARSRSSSRAHPRRPDQPGLPPRRLLHALRRRPLRRRRDRAVCQPRIRRRGAPRPHRRAPRGQQDRPGLRLI